MRTSIQDAPNSPIDIAIAIIPATINGPRNNGILIWVKICQRVIAKTRAFSINSGSWRLIAGRSKRTTNGVAIMMCGTAGIHQNVKNTVEILIIPNNMPNPNIIPDIANGSMVKTSRGLAQYEPRFSSI